MSYAEALSAAGLVVEKIIYCGEWQGIWAAKLADDTYIIDYFGSCTGCDHYEGFMADFPSAWATEPNAVEAREDALRIFGQTYVDQILTREEYFALVMERYSDNYDGEHLPELLALADFEQSEPV